MILTGMPLEKITTMDLMTFNALLPIVNRVVYRDKAENVWASFMAVNGGFSGKDEGVRALMDGWLDGAGVSKSERMAANKKTGADFLRDFKVGNGGRF